MTLPASGPISFNAINIELGLSGTATKSMNDSNYRTLAEVASGSIDLQDFYDKSNVIFTPVGGTTFAGAILYDDFRINEHPITATYTLTCNITAVWNWTKSGGIGTASVATGGSGTSITFNLTSVASINREVTFNINGVAGGITRYFTVTLITDDSNNG